MSIGFLANAVGMGAGLAMDAFSVSAVNALNEPNMSRRKMAAIAGVFAGFQILMPLLGWVCVHTIIQIFRPFSRFVPWIAMILLLYIGGKMLYEGIHADSEDTPPAAVGTGSLIVQGIATSIDALSVGFTIAELDFPMALLESLIIGGVTYIICISGLLIGKRFGTQLSGRAGILGGLILIFIGLKIFFSR